VVEVVELCQVLLEQVEQVVVEQVGLDLVEQRYQDQIIQVVVEVEQDVVHVVLVVQVS
tara:strand:- start:36 stop:209 length:174 start_codon:yes stop_codon:yes gene_type:complete